MKLVYSHENRFLVNNAKNILLNDGIDVVVKNEFAQGSAGDLSPFDTWLELWVTDEAKAATAITIIEQAFANKGSSWRCQHCYEENEASFEICWQCQQPLES